MIISHKYKYLFIQLPKTASTAIEKELIELYEGEPFLLKHDMYHRFEKQASAEQKKYTVFASVRNPMDIVASHYYNLLQDNRISKRTPKKHKLARKIWGSYRTKKRFEFLREDGADFKKYFLKFYSSPYANWSIVDHKRFDFIIHYEQMQEDFTALLKKLGIEQKRPIPMANKTVNKKGDFLDLYKDDEVIQRAVNVFGPYFKEFGYEFPAEWSSYKTSAKSMQLYPVYNMFRKFYWKNLR